MKGAVEKKTDGRVSPLVLKKNTSNKRGHEKCRDTVTGTELAPRN